MSVQKGSAVVWSHGTTATGTGVFATGIVDSVEYEQSPETDEKTYGTDGKVANRVFADTLERIVLNVIPTGATIAAAKAANVLPAIGADITIVDSDDAEIAGSGTTNGTGTYIYVGGSKTKNIRGKGMIRMTVERQETHLATAAAS